MEDDDTEIYIHLEDRYMERILFYNDYMENGYMEIGCLQNIVTQNTESLETDHMEDDYMEIDIPLENNYYMEGQILMTNMTLEMVTWRLKVLWQIVSWRKTNSSGQCLHRE